MILMTLLAATAASPAPALVRTAVMAVRVEVRETCSVSASAVQCRGAAPSAPPRVKVSADGVTTVEF